MDKVLLGPKCSHTAQEREPEHTKGSGNITGKKIRHGEAVAGSLFI